MYRVVATSWGGTRKPFVSGFSDYDKAVDFCDDHDWVVEFGEGGYIWDLEIEEYEDEEEDGIPEDTTW